MRLKSVWISEYKNLKDFTLTFEDTSFIDVFVGKNGTGKSNLFEALILIFQSLYEKTSLCPFNFRIVYEINGKVVQHGGDKGSYGEKFTIHEFSSEEERTIAKGNKSTDLPDNILIYYSGHNDTVGDIVKKYEASFSKKIKKADFDESRRFIGIGSEYKGLLLAILLLQKNTNKARQYVCKSLNINDDVSTVVLKLKRPYFVKKSFEIDHFEPLTHFWGTEGITKEFLFNLQNCIADSFSHPDIYDKTADRYTITISRETFLRVFSGKKSTEQFRLFDNLKTLGMIDSISASVTLQDGTSANISQFSDGQFQLVYIYAIMELFKDRNCVTLLDEPDSFLHPEWQFEYLNQVLEFTEEASAQNHVLLSSHSAATITKFRKPHLGMFEFDGAKVVVNQVPKAEIISSLSGGKIAFSEAEARLNINHVLRNTTKPILFTEGITDELILETAWNKLYPGVERPFEIQNAFCCSMLRILMKDDAFYSQHSGRSMFFLFDFDQAYNEWNQIGKDNDIETDPAKCLTKKRKDNEGYAMLLPISPLSPVCRQVVNPKSGSIYASSSRFTIEHLFYSHVDTDVHFVLDATIPGDFYVFVDDKKKKDFAANIVPPLPPVAFGEFHPIFDFIKGKIQ